MYTPSLLGHRMINYIDFITMALASDYIVYLQNAFKSIVEEVEVGEEIIYVN